MVTLTTLIHWSIAMTITNSLVFIVCFQDLTELIFLFLPIAPSHQDKLGVFKLLGNKTWLWLWFMQPRLTREPLLCFRFLCHHTSSTCWPPPTGCDVTSTMKMNKQSLCEWTQRLTTTPSMHYSGHCILHDGWFSAERQLTPNGGEEEEKWQIFTRRKTMSQDVESDDHKRTILDFFSVESLHSIALISKTASIPGPDQIWWSTPSL